MPLRNTTARWGSVAQLFHWLIVGLIITQFVLINLAQRQPDLTPAHISLILKHKSFGITIFMLAVLRLIWRSFNTAPPLPDTLKPYERFLAHFTHISLYVLIFAMPLSGWMMSSARSFAVSWFGLFRLPDLVSPAKGTYELLHETHETLATALIVVAALHVLAALKHHFFLKDGVLLRMLPCTRTPR
jgi:cytochrome b561